MYGNLKEFLQKELSEIKEAGLYKEERIIVSPQDAVIKLSNGQEVINFCANNYLGLSSHPEVIEAAKDTLESRGFGMSSVRFICGTQDIHKDLEHKIARFYGTDDTILYAAAFDANGGIFEPLLSAEDAIISDSLNHASIIDGVRLCKAMRYRYANSDMEDLKKQLIQANKDGARFKIIVTDGVFSMDGLLAPLDQICDLADQYEALVMVDECHAAGFIGATGRGTLEAKNVMGRVDIVTGTLGKALGGAMGGYTTGRKEIVALLRQRSRPYLFSNSLAPTIVGASLKVFEILENDTSLRDKLEKNVLYFKKEIKNAGFDIIEGDSAIVPIMLYDAKLAQKMANMLIEKGIYVIGFFFPVVPKERARIRVQLSAAHEIKHLDEAIRSFIEVGKALNVI
ncbi:glycine C-acetyltransferase [Flavobacteriaceae bacterium F89]|uniref:2-amino-3-ketobutyrate coenzyme A ligase n=1 Tax=Cerina litoralis TaxID=2874477 RepID=A0AAE3JM29_9FLAO|nr:glycine C-acetyltransferase [Cerina litoralis]MCG2459330.1 glycine C-acetyltransferase [Cerina litoralis]